MKLTLLLERISDIVYRIVPGSTLIRNLKSNTFQLSPALTTGIDASHQRGKLFFLSLSRSKINSYFNPHGVSSNAAIYVLDGRKLSHNYKGVPVDYFAVDKSYTTMKSDEMEDRIISDKSVIPNAVKYIKEVHVYVNLNDSSGHLQAMKIKDVIDSRNISAYYYHDKKDFISLNKTKASNNPFPKDFSPSKNGYDDPDETFEKVHDTLLYAIISFYKTKDVKYLTNNSSLHMKLNVIADWIRKYNNAENIFVKNDIEENLNSSIRILASEIAAEYYALRKNKAYIRLLDEYSKIRRKNRIRNQIESIKLLVSLYKKYK